MICRGVWLAVSILVGSIVVALPSLAEQRPDIAILFDQSGSIARHDPKLASKAWLLTFLKTFSEPHKVALVGFDEELHEHLAVDTGSSADITALTDAVDAIITRGLATDLEVPFKYLVDHGDPPVKLALIISDGEPEIWDGKLGYLSRRVRMDPRYDDLTTRYHEMEAAGVPRKQMYDQLGALFHTRNIDLIEAQMPKLSKLVGNRLVIWDLSGTSYYLRTWARAAGAQYMPMRVAAGESPVENLRRALVALQRTSSDVIGESLPAHHEGRAEEVLSAIAETAPALRAEAEKGRGPGTPAPTPAPAPAPAPEGGAEATRPPIESPPPTVASPPVVPPPPVTPTPVKELEGSSPYLLPLFLLALLIVAAASYSIGRRRRAPPVTSGEIAGVQVSPAQASTAVAAPVAADIAPPVTRDLAPSPPVDLAAEFIDSRVKGMVDDAERLRRRLLLDEGGTFDTQERRLSLRVVVPEGAMVVHWVAEDGTRHQSPAHDISMRGISFATGPVDAASITHIVCPGMETTLGVVKSRILRQNAGQAAAVLTEFTDDLDDWMRWVEIITRIDEGTTRET
ncbi:MAG: VWA domain-containing protein [Alphaproteobacteria bacterium]